MPRDDGEDNARALEREYRNTWLCSEERERIARKIYEVSQSCADGYRRNISQFNTAHENETAERCACAASNAGYFILEALGLSHDEIKALKE